MSETQLVPNMTADEAKELRSRLRAYTWTQRKLAEERKARRAERAAEMERHESAYVEADLLIGKLGPQIDALAQNIATLKAEIQRVRDAIDGIETERNIKLAEREKAYAERNAARDALKKLRAEIRGENGEEVGHVQACE